MTYTYACDIWVALELPLFDVADGEQGGVCIVSVCYSAVEGDVVVPKLPA